MKTIFAKHVRVGDTVLLPHMGRPITVKAWGIAGEGAMEFLYGSWQDPSWQIVSETSIVTLLHRPYSKEKSVAQMQEDIKLLARRLLNASEAEADDFVRRLGEAIEAYELGKPREEL